MKRVFCTVVFVLVAAISFGSFLISAHAVGPANIALTPEMDRRTRMAATLLLDAIGKFIVGLTSLESNKSGTKSFRQSVVLLLKSAGEMNSVLKEFEKELRGAKFSFQKDQAKTDTLVAWYAKAGTNYSENGFVMYQTYAEYVFETGKVFGDVASRGNLSPPDIERVTFEFGDRLNYLFKVGSIISEGFSPKADPAGIAAHAFAL